MPLTTRVSESVYCVQRRDYLSCSYFVVGADGVTLIDAGIDVSAADMIEGLAEAGRTPADIRAILLTHWHNDHSSGAAELIARASPRVYYHSRSRGKFTRELLATGPRGWIAKQLPDAGFWAPTRGLLELAPPRAIHATHDVSDGQLVENAFRVIETPGHEAGHVSYFFEPERVLFAGDSLAVAGDRIVFMSRFLTDDRRAARESMLRMLDVPAAAICPGHRYPLINPSPREIERIRTVLQSLRWWPIIGC